MRPKCRCRPPLTAPVRTPIVGIRVNCFFSVRCPLSPHDNCFTYFTFGFGATGHIHRTQDNWQLCFYGKNFASGNKRWLRVTSGGGSRFWKHFCFLSNRFAHLRRCKSWKSELRKYIQTYLWEFRIWCVRRWNVEVLWVELWVQMYSPPRGPRGVAPSWVRVSRFVSGRRPSFFSIAPCEERYHLPYKSITPGGWGMTLSQLPLFIGILHQPLTPPRPNTPHTEKYSSVIFHSPDSRNSFFTMGTWATSCDMCFQPPRI